MVVIGLMETRLKNEVNIMIKSKRKLIYFSQKLHEGKCDSKETWTVLDRRLLILTDSTDNYNEVTCHKGIANILNTHFATVSDKVLQESEHSLSLSEFQEL